MRQTTIQPAAAPPSHPPPSAFHLYENDHLGTAEELNSGQEPGVGWRAPAREAAGAVTLFKQKPEGQRWRGDRRGRRGATRRRRGVTRFGGRRGSRRWRQIECRAQRTRTCYIARR
eukprot:7302210-Prymnesium_polylepis.1